MDERREEAGAFDEPLTVIGRQASLPPTFGSITWIWRIWSCAPSAWRTQVGKSVCSTW